MNPSGTEVRTNIVLEYGSTPCNCCFVYIHGKSSVLADDGGDSTASNALEARDLFEPRDALEPIEQTSSRLDEC